MLIDVINYSNQTCKGGSRNIPLRPKKDMSVQTNNQDLINFYFSNQKTVIKKKVEDQRPIPKKKVAEPEAAEQSKEPIIASNFSQFISRYNSNRNISGSGYRYQRVKAFANTNRARTSSQEEPGTGRINLNTLYRVSKKHPNIRFEDNHKIMLYQAKRSPRKLEIVGAKRLMIDSNHDLFPQTMQGDNLFQNKFIQQQQLLQIDELKINH